MNSTEHPGALQEKASTPGPRALSCCTALALLATMLLVAPLTSEAAEETRGKRSRRPNVLIFLTDDQRIGTLRHMPATRRLIGRKGVTFRNAFATTPLCCPSRASIMTGQFAHNHHVRKNSVGRRLDMSTTLQHNLDRAGYLNAIVGKFLNGWNALRTPPHFDRSVVLAPRGSPASQGSDAYYGASFSINGRKRAVRRYATDFIRARTIKILRQFNRRDEQPWMMYVHPYAPHAPAVPARRHAGAIVGGVKSNPAIRNRNRSEKAPDVRRRRDDQAHAQHFAANQKRTLIAVDELVASVFRRLTRLKEARNTLVIYMSDNGMMWGEHGLVNKRFPYTHSIKIPMLMRWPGHVRSNSNTGRLVANVDIAPTIYDATDVEPAHVMDGRSLLNRGERRFVLLEHWEKTQWRSLRSHRYQYIEYYDEGELRFRELYNLKRDPWQLRNLMRDSPRKHRAVASRLHRLLMRKADCRGTECL